MALQFRKRLKLAKGMYLNLSQSGVSMSVGTKGARLTTERVNWRKWLGTAALAGAAALAPMNAHGAGSEAQWEEALNRSWHELNPKQRIELVQSERNWIKWKDSLPDQDRYNAIRNRVNYLDTYREKGSAVAEDDQLDARPRDPTVVKIPVDSGGEDDSSVQTQQPSDDEVQEALGDIWLKLSDQQREKAKPTIERYNKQQDYQAELAYLKSLLAAGPAATPTPAPQPATQQPQEEADAPTVDWIREAIRETLAEQNGVSVDYYRAIPVSCFLYKPVLPNGEWWAMFRSTDSDFMIKGKGKTVAFFNVLPH